MTACVCGRRAIWLTQVKSRRKNRTCCRLPRPNGYSAPRVEQKGHHGLFLYFSARVHSNFCSRIEVPTLSRVITNSKLLQVRSASTICSPNLWLG